MNLGKRSAIIFPIVILSIFALLTAWINHIVQPPQPKLDGSSRHDPDYIMSNFVTSQTDVNGKLRYKLAAEEMKHFPDDDTTDLRRPNYTQFNMGKPYTQVEALRGYVASNGEQVQLVDKVKITRQAFAGKGEMSIETEYLNILPNQDLVRTDSPVVIKQAPKTVIYATGMVYEKNEKTVTLLHNVRAHYDKPNIKPLTVNEIVKKNTTKTSSVKSKSKSTNKALRTKTSSKKLTKSNETATQKAIALLQKSSTNKLRIRRNHV
jgi:lipopolysaccharide export system protein LptC